MTDWAHMGKLEKTVRVSCAVAMAAKLVECVRREDVIGATICSLSAVAALGLEAGEIRAVLSALERTASEGEA
ncbi:hypothetical protein MYX77_07895 [Acidobacteriia bacterium AH_259_A11_L15]|nr:hypothetical protein [Acidobacteriia bacterium AH_259_A11_L15]